MGFYYSKEENGYNDLHEWVGAFDTKEEALIDAQRDLLPGEKCMFSLGCETDLDLSLYIDMQNVLEHVATAVYEDVDGDFEINILKDIAEEAEKEFYTFMKQWFDRYTISCPGSIVTPCEEHISLSGPELKEN